MFTRFRANQRPRSSLQIQLDRLASDRWARQGVRLLVRSIVLGLSIACGGVGLYLLLGWPLRWQWLAAAALACIAVAAAMLLRPRMSAAEVARRLDRRFQLHEQLATALELRGRAEGVGVYLEDQSRRSLGQIRRYITARQQFPWAELALALALIVALLGLLILSGIVPPIPGAAVEPLPAIVRPEPIAEQLPEEPFQPPGTQPGPGEGASPMPGPGDQAAAAALADALRDQSVTRPAAEALDQGDTAGAAQSLREVADQADQLSDQARNDLAQGLSNAASQVQGQNPGLAEQLRQSAEGLRSGDDQAAADALEGLADAVEQLGQGQSQQQGEGQGQGQGAGGAGQGLGGEQRTQPNQRLGVDGVPLELEGEGAGTTPAPGAADGPAEGRAEGGFTQGRRDLSSERVQAGDDPLRIPADLRDVVQDYFSP